MTLKDGYGFDGFSGTPPSEPNLSTPPPPPPGVLEYPYPNCKTSPLKKKKKIMRTPLEPTMMMFAKWSGTYLSLVAFGVYVQWLLRGIRGNITVIKRHVEPGLHSLAARRGPRAPPPPPKTKFYDMWEHRQNLYFTNPVFAAEKKGCARV